MLDRLHNREINKELNALLFAPKTPNYQALTPNHLEQIKHDSTNLCTLLKMQNVRPFNFSLETFHFLLQFFAKHYKVALALSSHYLFYQAYLHLDDRENIFPLLPDSDTGTITRDSIEFALQNGAECFIIPYLNEDILTQNHIEMLPKNVLKIVDISYCFALNLPLPNADLFLLNGENLGIMRPFGILASNNPSFHGIPNIYLEIQNLYHVFTQAILLLHNKIHTDYTKIFFQTLEATLKNDCYMFYQTPPNTLALGLKGIKARELIQSLMFDGISLINGQTCLFGFNQPSFVLRLMGYNDAQSRELLSLSFLDIAPQLIPQIANKIAQKYKQLRSLQA